MITFNGLDLFSSGPSRTIFGPVEGRDALAQSPGAIGVMLTQQGRQPREITQRGTLVADTEPALRELTTAIEGQVGAAAATLTDEHGNDWPDCVLRVFEPGPVGRLGPRYTLDYITTYLQVSP